MVKITVISFFLLFPIGSFFEHLTQRPPTSGGHFNWTDCSTDDAKKRMSLEHITISPNADIREGQHFEITANVTLHEKITSGQALVSIQYGGLIPVVDENIDFCDLMTHTYCSRCPMKVGFLTVATNQTKLPEYIPTGTYEGSMLINNQNNKQLVYIEFKFTFE